MSEPISGVYESLITRRMREAIEGLPAERVLRTILESERAPEALARHLYFVIRRALAILSESTDADLLRIRLEISNRVLAALEEFIPGSLEDEDVLEISEEPWLVGITDPPERANGLTNLATPLIPIDTSALLVNGRSQPRIGHELKAELCTTDEVSLLCSFVMHSGLRIVHRELVDVIRRGGRVRVLTTTYMGATQKRALDELHDIGAEIRISYSGDTTRLHAKAWLLERRTGASTAYVGSSNLSSAALVDGLEWNVRLSNREQPHIINTIRGTFEGYWNDADFEEYHPARDGERLSRALATYKDSRSDQISISFANIEVTPRPFQQEILDRLQAERELFGRFKNLIVMATGTGKTVVAALDYKRIAASIQGAKLLFVAHRKEILGQSLATFRTVMRSGSFGELYVDGAKPTEWKHVFASVQSLSRIDQESLRVDSFDYIIIDEFHHAAASTYARLLDYFKPKYLLGLTATPERADGEDILRWFDGKASIDLRLWEAIDRQILVPFQYFGLNDNVDLESAGIPWRRGVGYDLAALDKIYTGNDARVALILEQLSKYVDDIGNLCAIGFCVSMDHAEFMAARFQSSGIPAAAVTSRLGSEQRELILADLRNGAIKVVFAVDIFNEGVDVPQVNTLLMLRPTESATIFLQQLGRGLRKHEGKRALTVLDFVGNQNKNFRFDLKYGQLLGLTKRQLIDAAEDDFPTLPSGCHFELDRVSKDQVISRLKNAIRVNQRTLVADLRLLGDVSLEVFLDQSGIEVEELYRNERCFTFLVDEVQGRTSERSDFERKVAKTFSRILHIDDLRRIQIWREALVGDLESLATADLMMVGYSLFGASSTLSTVLENLNELRSSDLRAEILSLIGILDRKRTRVVVESSDQATLAVHARYTRDEILAAFEVSKPSSVREGVKWVDAHKSDLAFVTLNKSERHFSPTTMYADTAISESLFQWESQSQTADTSRTGQRYINHRGEGSKFHLFVRDYKNDPATGATMPYLYLGCADYLSHTGSRPMRILWKLRHQIPADVLVRSRVIAS